MHIRVTPAMLADKPVIAEMLQGPYLRELSAYFAPGKPPTDHYDYPYLDAYWQEPRERFPFLITVDGDVAGFAFVNRYSRLGAGNTWNVAEFYVNPEFRRGGVGSIAAEHVLRQFPGDWEVAVLTGNDPALVFWQRVIAQVAAGNVVEQTTARWNGVIYTFAVEKN